MSLVSLCLYLFLICLHLGFRVLVNIVVHLVVCSDSPMGKRKSTWPAEDPKCVRQK